MTEKSAEAFRTISEVATDLDVPQHVLRFWESKFPQVKPLKRAGGRRYYRPQDIELLRAIKQLLYGEGFTIRGVQRILKERGARMVMAALHDGVPIGSAVAVSAMELDDDSVEPIAAEDEAREQDEEARGQDESEEAAEAKSPPPEPNRGPATALAPADVEKLRMILADLERCHTLLAAARRD